MPLITRQFGPNPKGSTLTYQELDNNLLLLEVSQLDLGTIGNITVTGSTEETAIYSQKIPANFYKVGQMFTFGHAIGAYFGYDSNGIVGPGGIPSPILLPSQYSDSYYTVDVSQTVTPQLGYANQTLTFSQDTTSGGGSGMQIEATFDASGYLTFWKMLNGGSDYLPSDSIITDEPIPGEGTLDIQVYRTETSGDPNARIRAYWSYTEGGLDNLIKQVTLDFSQPTWVDLFSVLDPITNISGFRAALSQIITTTTIRQITSQETGSPYTFNISDVPLPDVTQDVWITLTCELENSSTSLTTGLITVVRNVTDLDKFVSFT